MQVGDYFMFYLLRNTSVFLPAPHGKHHQVGGPPINDLCFKMLKGSSKFCYQNNGNKKCLSITLWSHWNILNVTKNFCEDGFFFIAIKSCLNPSCFIKNGMFFYSFRLLILCSICYNARLLINTIILKLLVLSLKFLEWM